MGNKKERNISYIKRKQSKGRKNIHITDRRSITPIFQKAHIIDTTGTLYNSIVFTYAFYWSNTNNGQKTPVMRPIKEQFYRKISVYIFNSTSSHC